jgi:hypothetical protein
MSFNHLDSLPWLLEAPNGSIKDSVGGSYDNGNSERFFRTLKQEGINTKEYKDQGTGEGGKKG